MESTTREAIEIALSYIIPMALLGMVGVLVTRKLLHGRVNEGHNDVLVPLFLTAGTIYAVLLGFTVVAVWESFDAAKSNVADEAATLVVAYRETSGMDAAHGARLRESLRHYTEAVISDEWKIQAQQSGSGSQKARRAIGEMFRSFSELEPKVREADAQMNSQFLLTVAQIVADGNKRAIQAVEALPWVMWLGAIGGGILVVGMSLFLFMERAWPHLVMSTSMAALIGSLLFATAILEGPFEGPMAIEVQPFENALHVFAEIDHGN